MTYYVSLFDPVRCKWTKISKHETLAEASDAIDAHNRDVLEIPERELDEYSLDTTEVEDGIWLGGCDEVEYIVKRGQWYNE